MWPLLQPGDEVLVKILADSHSQLSVGNLVIVQHPQQPHLCLIKRIIAVNEDGDFFVQGDNINYSTDSRVFGWVKPELILGFVTCKFG
jgi:nickel-type superoxide dismutase maturation protease